MDTPPALAAGNQHPETGWRSWLSLPRDRFNSPWMTVLLIVIAWSVCALVRYQWIAWAGGVEQNVWLGEIQPTTHDAFTHGAVLQQHLEGLHGDNPHLFPLLNKQGALHALTWAFMKVVPVSIPTVLLWGPVILASLIVIPFILIGRLFGSSLWGFTAAILAGVAWNFYERTMAGYFDTDVFSFTGAMLLVYFLMGAHRNKSLTFAGLGAFAVFLYPFFYAKGLVIGAGIAGCFIGLQLICMLLKMDVDRRLRMIALVAAGTAASPWSNGGKMYSSPWLWFIGVIAIAAAWYFLASPRSGGSTRKTGVDEAIDDRVTSGSGGPVSAVGMVVGACLIWLILSMPWSYFLTQVKTYSRFLETGEQAIVQTDPVELQRAEILDEINFRKTHKSTVLESQGEALYKLAQRIIGSSTGAILAIIGYVLMCFRYPGFLIGLPVAVIGAFSIDGGLRFTTWGGLMAAPALVYALFIGVKIILRCLPRLSPAQVRLGSIVGGMLLASPFIAINIAHAVAFKVNTIFSQEAIETMRVIKENSKSGDYVISWWDYGSGLWYYSERNVLMTPISASDDCWTVAKIVSSDSQDVAAGLSRLAAESAAAGHRPSSHHYLDIQGDSPIWPEDMIKQLEEGRVELPDPTCDVFLYMPLEMIKLLRVLEAYADPAYALPVYPESGVYHVIDRRDVRALSEREVILPNQIIVDMNALTASVESQDGRIPVEFESITYVGEMPNGSTFVRQGPKAAAPPFRLAGLGGSRDFQLVSANEPVPDGYHLVHLVVLQESGLVLILDSEFLNSNLIQMVAMQQFDKDLWELVHKNGYARVFRLKRPNQATIKSSDAEDPVTDGQ